MLITLTIIALGYVFYLNFSQKQVICKDCGCQQNITKTAKGSLLIEIILWCCFLVPGLIYSIWRSQNRAFKCSNCSSWNVIPVSSPIGKQLISQNQFQQDSQRMEEHNWFSKNPLLTNEKQNDSNPQTFSSHHSMKWTFSRFLFLAFIIFPMFYYYSTTKNAELRSPSLDTARVVANEQAISSPKKSKKNKLWDGDYKSINCKTAKECAQIGYEREKAGKKMESWPYRARGCELGLPGLCTLIAWHYGGLSQDEKLANEENLELIYKWYLKGCLVEQELNVSEKNNCLSVARIDLIKNNVESAKNYYKVACSNYFILCHLYPHKNKKMDKKIKHILEPLCEEGHSTACIVLNKK